MRVFIKMIQFQLTLVRTHHTSYHLVQGRDRPLDQEALRREAARVKLRGPLGPSTCTLPRRSTWLPCSGTPSGSVSWTSSGPKTWSETCWKSWCSFFPFAHLAVYYYYLNAAGVRLWPSWNWVLICGCGEFG